MDESLAKEEENPLYITDKNENPVKILAKMKKNVCTFNYKINFD